MCNLIECRDIYKTYNEGAFNTPVLKGVSLEISKGDLTAIVGSSGSGKSTLLHILGALDHASQGEVTFLGKNIHELSRDEQASIRNIHMGFIYQFHHLMIGFTALENIAMPLMISGMRKKAAKIEANKLLKKVGLEHRAGHRPSELSGGERQRVAIARALANKPDLVLADEPTGNLDRKTGLDIYNLMKEMNSEFNTAFLVVTHDKELANKMDRQLHMQDGVFINA